MTKLILTRHGQSVWNAENRFTGWVDVDLSEQGMTEAKKSGQLIKDLHINVLTDAIIQPVIENYVKDVNLDLRGNLTKSKFLKFSRVLNDYIDFLKKEKIIN